MQWFVISINKKCYCCVTATLLLGTTSFYCMHRHEYFNCIHLHAIRFLMYSCNNRFCFTCRKQREDYTPFNERATYSDLMNYGNLLLFQSVFSLGFHPPKLLTYKQRVAMMLPFIALRPAALSNPIVSVKTRVDLTTHK